MEQVANILEKRISSLNAATGRHQDDSGGEGASARLLKSGSLGELSSGRSDSRPATYLLSALHALIHFNRSIISLSLELRGKGAHKRTAVSIPNSKHINGDSDDSQTRSQSLSAEEMFVHSCQLIAPI